MKTLKTIQKVTLLAAVGFGLAVVGCDSGSSCADGGVCDGGVGGASGLGGAGGGAVANFGLSAGTFCFDVTGTTGIVDGCGITPGAIGQLPVTYTTTATAGVVAVGRDGSIGQGAIMNNTGTLARSGTSMDGPACSWTQMDTSTLTMTADNAFTVSVSETASGFTATCVPAPPSDPCTSTWTWTMKIHAPAKLPDVAGNCE